MIISYINDYVLSFPLSFCLKISIFSKFLLWLFLFISLSAPITLQQQQHISVFSSPSSVFLFDLVFFLLGSTRCLFLPTLYLLSVSPTSNYVFFFVLMIFWCYVIHGVSQNLFFPFLFILLCFVEHYNVLLCWIYSCFRILCIQCGEMDSIWLFCNFMWMT